MKSDIPNDVSSDRPNDKPVTKAGKPRGGKKQGSKPAKGRQQSRKPRAFERARGGPARQIADLMPEIGRTAFRKFGFVQSSVVTRWPEIAGERYAAVSLPQSIRFPVGQKSDGTLVLTVSGPHAVMMQHVLPEIIERVNRFFGYSAVSRVKLQQGEVKPPRSSEPPATPPKLKPIPMALGDSLRDIGDPELLAVLESMARGLDDEKAHGGTSPQKLKNQAPSPTTDPATTDGQQAPVQQRPTTPPPPSRQE